MQRSLIRFLVLGLGAVLVFAAAYAQAPLRLQYQGHLTDGAGNTLPDGVYTFQFRIYNADTLGSVIWGPETQALPVNNGVFSAVLGDSSSSIIPNDFSGQRWLSIQVEPDTVEMYPRQKIVSAAGALTVANNSISSNQVQNSSLFDFDIADEPGAAHNKNTGFVNLTSSYQVVTSRSINCPSSGYVLAIGKAEFDIGHSLNTSETCQLAVSMSPSSPPITQDFGFVLDDQLPTGFYEFCITPHGIFSVSQGSNSFYLISRHIGSGASAWEGELSLIFVPTAYGSVTGTAVEGGEPLGEEAVQTIPDDEGSASPGVEPAPSTAELLQELSDLRARIEELEKERENQ
jgi:hypothetical protein